MYLQGVFVFLVGIILVTGCKSCGNSRYVEAPVLKTALYRLNPDVTSYDPIGTNNNSDWYIISNIHKGLVGYSYKTGELKTSCLYRKPTARAGH